MIQDLMIGMSLKSCHRAHLSNVLLQRQVKNYPVYRSFSPPSASRKASTSCSFLMGFAMASFSVSSTVSVGKGLRIGFFVTSAILLLVPALAVGSAVDGTCYTSAGMKGNVDVAPCSDTEQSVACCNLGDICLENNACFNYEYGVTYIYGCTDPSYTDPACPYKCHYIGGL